MTYVNMVAVGVARQTTCCMRTAATLEACSCFSRFRLFIRSSFSPSESSSTFAMAAS